MFISIIGFTIICIVIYIVIYNLVNSYAPKNSLLFKIVVSFILLIVFILAMNLLSFILDGILPNDDASEYQDYRRH